MAKKDRPQCQWVHDAGHRHPGSRCKHELDHLSFVCDTCKRSLCHRHGAADDLPDSCDDCWAAIHATMHVQVYGPSRSEA